MKWKNLQKVSPLIEGKKVKQKKAQGYFILPINQEI